MKCSFSLKSILCKWKQPISILEKVKVKSRSRVRLFATPRSVSYQAPLSIGFSRQDYWSVLPFPSPGDLPDPGIDLGLPHCRQTLYHLSHQGSPSWRRKWQSMDNKRVWNAELGCNLKNDTMITVHFQGKPFNIMVIQVYAPTSITLKKLKLNGSMKTYKTF